MSLALLSFKKSTLSHQSDSKKNNRELKLHLLSEIYKTENIICLFNAPNHLIPSSHYTQGKLFSPPQLPELNDLPVADWWTFHTRPLQNMQTVWDHLQLLMLSNCTFFSFLFFFNYFNFLGLTLYKINLWNVLSFLLFWTHNLSPPFILSLPSCYFNKPTFPDFCLQGVKLRYP